jgi:hypothetical protein
MRSSSTLATVTARWTSFTIPTAYAAWRDVDVRAAADAVPVTGLAAA